MCTFFTRKIAQENPLVSTLESLKQNPMFYFSLGSKELFHSNFLEFLWEQDRKSFLRMLLKMLNGKNTKLEEMIKKSDSYYLAREQENFDICIYHYNYKKTKKNYDDNDIEYDVIIENKVKSIPYSQQLEKYVAKVDKEKSAPIYILLSLATKFLDKHEIQNANTWRIVHYDSLLTAIKKNYHDKNICSAYIIDYCRLIEDMQILQEHILNVENSSSFFDAQSIKIFEKIRMHDLYHKLRGSYFVGELYMELQSKYKDKLNRYNIVFFTGTNFEERRSADKPTIYLSSSMNRGKSTITAAIVPIKDGDMYEIQVEEQQYRHMFNHKGITQKDSKELTKIVKHDYFCSFPNKLQTIENNREVKPYNCYKPNVIYKYKKFADKMNFKQMKETMAADIVNVCGQIDSTLHGILIQ